MVASFRGSGVGGEPRDIAIFVRLGASACCPIHGLTDWSNDDVKGESECVLRGFGWLCARVLPCPRCYVRSLLAILVYFEFDLVYLQSSVRSAMCNTRRSAGPNGMSPVPCHSFTLYRLSVSRFSTGGSSDRTQLSGVRFDYATDLRSTRGGRGGRRGAFDVERRDPGTLYTVTQG
jgi:hypothetical protein